MTGQILALSSALLALTFVVSCSQTPQLSSIVVTPTSATIPNAGATAQFQATGTFLNGKNGGQNMQNLTDQVTWTSSVSSVATINSTGLATATGEGTTTITATGGNGGVTGTATLTVSSSATGNLTSLTVLPVNQTVPSASQTVQYIAIGTFTGSQPTQDVTNQVTWSSSDATVATVTATGLATTAGTCAQGLATTITAALSTFTGTANLTYGSCGQIISPTLTISGPGLGTGTITSTPTGINCNTSSDTGCTANFTLNSQVSLTATPAPGSVFAGWSANCQPAQNNTCTVTMANYETVGVFFNLQP